jgi:hypothetical protein
MDKTIVEFSARIKSGASVFMDFSVVRWPYKGDDDLDIFFDVKYNGSHFDCTAYGYGQRGSSESYGNGSIFVTNMDDFVQTPNLNHPAIIVFEHQKNKILEQMVMKARELDELRQKYETLLTKEPKLVT